MDVPFFIAYMTAGFLISVAVFWWALANRQFRDQKRAAFLPLLHDTDEPPKRVTRMNRIEGVALIAVACLGLLLSASVIGWALIRS
jgi:cbb3-type cytochrome oxidase maturation protein